MYINSSRTFASFRRNTFMFHFIQSAYCKYLMNISAYKKLCLLIYDFFCFKVYVGLQRAIPAIFSPSTSQASIIQIELLKCIDCCNVGKHSPI